MAPKTSVYSDEQRALIAQIGRAAALMGLRQEDAARRATEVLGVNVSQSSVSRAILADDAPALDRLAKEDPETLFDWANMEATGQVIARLDEIIRIMKGARP